MKRILLLSILVLIVLSVIPAYSADWKQEVEALLVSAETGSREAMLASILGAGPDPMALRLYLLSRERPEVIDRGELYQRDFICSDGKNRPCVFHVPADYDRQKPTPLLVVLHGGVSRVELREKPLEWAKKSPFYQLAREKGWFVLFPMGQAGCTWWDETGMSMINGEIVRMKQDFNIDDDRVWMAGFSDGASAGFLHAMVKPSSLAAVVALNGHMGVGSLDGKLATYAGNMINTPVYAVTTASDSLYPTEKMAPTVEMAQDAWADIFYRVRPGTHDFDYSADELPRIGRFLERHPRNPMRPRIDWESGDFRFGRCHWFVIDSLKIAEPENWHRDANCILTDDRVSIGFMPGPAGTGETGVGVTSVVDDTFAARAGVLAGDVIIGLAGQPVVDGDGLEAIKATLRRGEKVSLQVRRGSEEVMLEAKLPPTQNYLLFKREVPSCRVRVSVAANRVNIRGSRLGECRIRVHPDMFRLEDPIRVVLNGWTVFEGQVKADPEYILRTYLAERDGAALPVAEIPVKVE